jgi:hypothetical protein
MKPLIHQTGGRSVAVEKGFPDGFNAARRDTMEETFLLRAYIVSVGADMIGRAKVGISYIFHVQSANIN